MLVNIECFKEMCRYVFQKFLTNDCVLVKNKNYEPTISGRMAIYFRDVLGHLEKQNIFVDVEYNKFDVADKKRYIQSDETTKNIRPDIIIHKRTKQTNNLLYCELKKRAQRNGSDKQKVEEQVKDKNYKFGLYINKINAIAETIEFQIYHENRWNYYTYKLSNNSIEEINQ